LKKIIAKTAYHFK